MFLVFGVITWKNSKGSKTNDRVYLGNELRDCSSEMLVTIVRLSILPYSSSAVRVTPSKQ